MRKALYFITAIFVSIGIANAAVRDTNALPRTDTKSASSAPSRSSSKTTARTSGTNTISRNASTPRSTARTATNARVTKTTTARTAQTPIHPARSTQKTNTQTRPARATVSISTTQSNTFGTEYNMCRNAYFTCMDQFCATANDTYRRCVCSSKLGEIQSRERALTQASDQLQDFKNLNISVIDKSAAEVNAIISATGGEIAQSNANDTSASASKLAGISAVLNQTKNKSLSTQGTLDIAGDINSIWATTDLTGGVNIANLTGKSLYNAVHAQCSEMVSEYCTTDSTRAMVVSAYGMYIENDCATLVKTLDKQLNNANDTIRDTEREMQLARLENYNNHNSTSINDCIAQVRSDITANTACGTDYVHCLDITGLYLTYETGEPIYTPNFYQLENQISLSGDILTNQTNRLIVGKLNNMRQYAKRGLDTCRDIADSVWDEFMRQAITEIYQGQHDRIRQVKDECLNVVNTCYDEQNKSLKDFSNIDENLLLGSRLELSEQMCQEKLDTCSNLYGGGTNGMQALLTAMHNITDQKIAQQCLVTLRNYAKDICAVPGNDTIHSYPYACRVYAPGDGRYATNDLCNKYNQTNKSTITIHEEPKTYADFTCPALRKYTSCKTNYYMTYNGKYNKTPQDGNKCTPCPIGYTCYGGTEDKKQSEENQIEQECGVDYIGSLYQKMVKYALQTCVRPSESDSSLPPATVLQDINVVMDEMHKSMAQQLSTECELLGGQWVDIPWFDVAWVDNEENVVKYKICLQDGTGCAEITQELYEKLNGYTAIACATDTTTGIIIPETCEEGQGSCHTTWGCTEPSVPNKYIIPNKYTTDGIHDKTDHTLFTPFYRETSTNPSWGYCIEKSTSQTGTTQ